jgi:hypothetical protein
MKFIKKYWYILLLTLITLGMGIVVFITGGKLTTKKPVAPTVPQVTPKASEPACTLTFTIATPTSTMTETPTQTPTSTPNPASCNDSCTVDTDCTSGLICSANLCLNPSCTGDTDCICPTPTQTPTPTNSPSPTATPTNTPTNTPSNTPTNTPSPTPTPLVGCNNYCTENANCTSGLICSENACRNPSCTEQTSCSCPGVTATPTPTPTPLVGCNNYCTVNSNCTSGLICSENACRNPSCTEQTSCSCPGVTATPTPTTYYLTGDTPTPTAIAVAPTPKTPISGIGPSWLGASIISGALLLIFLGLAL